MIPLVTRQERNQERKVAAAPGVARDESPQEQPQEVGLPPQLLPPVSLKTFHCSIDVGKEEMQAALQRASTVALKGSECISWLSEDSVDATPPNSLSLIQLKNSHKELFPVTESEDGFASVRSKSTLIRNMFRRHKKHNKGTQADSRHPNFSGDLDYNSSFVTGYNAYRMPRNPRYEQSYESTQGITAHPNQPVGVVSGSYPLEKLSVQDSDFLASMVEQGIFKDEFYISEKTGYGQRRVYFVKTTDFLEWRLTGGSQRDQGSSDSDDYEEIPDTYGRAEAVGSVELPRVLSSHCETQVELPAVGADSCRRLRQSDTHSHRVHRPESTGEVSFPIFLPDLT